MILRQALTAILASLISLSVRAGAPDIPLPDLEGRARNVNEFVGHAKWTIVVAWAHDCHICDREIGEMAQFHTEHKDKDAVVLGVTLDGKTQLKEARAFARRHELPFVNLLAEPSQDVMMKFGAGKFVGTPTYYVYDPQGDIVGQNIGPLTRSEVEDFIASYKKEGQADAD